MQCKKCNAYIPEGYMYCPVCGEEIIIVSDFEIKLEDNIDITGIANTVEIPDVSDLIDNQTIKNNKKNIRLRSKAGIAIIVALVVVAISISIGIKAIVDYNSYNYQYEKAHDAYNGKEYEKAIKILKRANNLSESDLDGIILLADSYIQMTNYDAAIAVLYKALDIYDDERVIDSIVTCYKIQGDNKGIHDLIKSRDDGNLALKYSEYVSISPSFSLEAGAYVEPDPIKLSAIGEGTIYYTTDGTNPTTDSLEYIGPIPLDYGTNTISAIYINEKGIASDIVTNVYEVSIDIVEPPKLLVPSGSVLEPKLIGVVFDENEHVYYTTDGSNPSDRSQPYTHPMLMPIGSSTYTFIAYNENGNSSETVRATYNLKLSGPIDVATAEYAISFQLISKGENVMLNTYHTNYGYSDGARTYYIIEEYAGSDKTGRRFAVDINSGALFSFIEADGNYSTSPL